MLLFALAVFVLIGIAGLALDFSRASDLKTRLQAAADSAVLNVLNPQNQNADQAQQARDFFAAVLSAEDAASVRTVTAALDRDDKGEPEKLTITFSAAARSALLQVLGHPEIAVGGSASAVIGLNTRSNFHFLIDTSDSMGLAATPQARDRLRQLTRDLPGGSCEFACHQAETLSLARAEGLPLRVDVARDGAERLVEMAQEYGGANARFMFSVQSINTGAVVVSPLTRNRADLVSALSSLEVGYGHQTGGAGADADTFYEISFPQASTWLDQAGSNGPSDIVVLVTDGVRSQNHGWQPDVRPINVEYCDLLKRGGRKLAVIYTEYMPVVDNTTYNETVGKFHDQIEINLRACASSPELFSKGDSPERIMRAFEDIFLNSLTKQVRLAS
ncbi:membrane protein [Agaricicola taiwanensis]|uniref:Membrane protein n=2 Tax=Agaricicola taiwanensis TaxID=591372 RepID=A0A8J2YJ12_9RHOB|nr:membrane protein [Agaricicola taiwanensis]